MNYYVYMITNSRKTTLYVGITNNLSRRLQEHYENRGNKSTFAGRYYCSYLVWVESYRSPEQAINREKEIKKWRRSKKEDLIKETNPEWNFINDEW